ncbi:MAG: hypothetical protein IT195_04055 [Microthrixaceae bacterium]|nr:hypothetical protein [Microthrixaceae bacterium]
MLVWFAAGSVAIVWAVFQSPAIDYRMVMVGSVLGVAEVPFGAGVLEALVVPCAALALVMGATVGRRLLRRRLLGVPIGMFLHQVLNGAWTDTELFWWPLGGGSLYEGRSMIVTRGLWSVALEGLGVALAVWCWRQFGLADGSRRALFVRSGRLDRAFVRGGAEAKGRR